MAFKLNNKSFECIFCAFVAEWELRETSAQPLIAIKGKHKIWNNQEFCFNYCRDVP